MIKKKESGEIIKPTTNNAPPKKMPRNDYSRYEQENFNKSQTGGFQIDTLGTNASKSFNSLVAGKKYVKVKGRVTSWQNSWYHKIL